MPPSTVARGADARDLLLADARILSISRAGDMAVLFGPQNSTHTFGERTLARIPIAGGARRDMLTGVVDADWIPGTDTLAVIRDPGGGRPWTVEFPAGKIVHEARAAWSLRVSRDGSSVAFFEGPEMFASAPQAMITVIDRAGRKETLSRDWAGFGLAWAPSGTEIWFTATRPGLHAPHIRAVSLSGRERAVYRAPDWLVLHDISADGRVLLSRNSIRINLVCKRPADTREHDLTWMAPLSPTDSRQTARLWSSRMSWAPRPLATRPSFADALMALQLSRLERGPGGRCLQTGRWVLALSRGSLVLLPTGAGPMVTLPKESDVVRFEHATWLATRSTLSSPATG